MEYDTNDELKKWAFTVHTGSRNLGKMVCQKWVHAAKGPSVDKEAMEKEIADFKANYTGDVLDIAGHLKKIREKYRTPDSDGYLEKDLLKGYLTDMVIAQAYAEFNHKIIGKLILESICYASGKPVHVKEVIHTTHNYVDFQMKMLRKGAVAAPEGRRLVIPFNMRRKRDA
jgi:RNA-splicing ligase RtcB